MGCCKSKREYINDCIFQPPKKKVYLKFPSKFKFLNIDNDRIMYCLFEPKKILTNKIIIFSHGNATDICYLNSYFNWLSNQLGTVIFAYDYRGYGYSTGQCSEYNCYEDINYCINYLTKNLKYDIDNLVFMGHSLGTGIIINYFYNNMHLNNLIILVSPYKTISKIVCDYSFSLIHKFNTEDKIKYLNNPIKLYHGINDKIINISHSTELWNLIKNKTIKPSWLPNVGHNDILTKLDIDEIFYLLMN
jgi:pimeloyl-ACP methyl ester carboxylesterase